MRQPRSEQAELVGRILTGDCDSVYATIPIYFNNHKQFNNCAFLPVIDSFSTPQAGVLRLRVVYMEVTGAIKNHQDGYYYCNLVDPQRPARRPRVIRKGCSAGVVERLVTMDTTTAAGWALYLAPIGIIEFGEAGIIADANLYSRVLLGASLQTVFGHSSGMGSAPAEREDGSWATAGLRGYWGDNCTIGSTPWGSLRVRLHPMLEDGSEIG